MLIKSLNTKFIMGTKKEQTLYEGLIEKGHSRRDFLKFCGVMGGMLGLEKSGVAQIAHAFETKKKLPVIWYHFQECTCCSESFIRASHPIVENILFDLIALEYDATLMAAARSEERRVGKECVRKCRSGGVTR